MNPIEVWHQTQSNMFLVVELSGGTYSRTLFARHTFHDACNDASLWIRRN